MFLSEFLEHLNSKSDISSVSVLTENLEMKKLLLPVLEHCNRLAIKFAFISQTEIHAQKNSLVFVDPEVT